MLKIIDFKGVHYPKLAILHAVFFYVRYAVSYRDLEEIFTDRGVEVDHATLNCWVVKYAPLIAAQAQAIKRPTASSWRMDETLEHERQIESLRSRHYDTAREAFKEQWEDLQTKLLDQR